MVYFRGSEGHKAIVCLHAEVFDVALHCVQKIVGIMDRKRVGGENILVNSRHFFYVVLCATAQGELRCEKRRRAGQGVLAPGQFQNVVKLFHVFFLLSFGVQIKAQKGSRLDTVKKTGDPSFFFKTGIQKRFIRGLRYFCKHFRIARIGCFSEQTVHQLFRLCVSQFHQVDPIVHGAVLDKRPIYIFDFIYFRRCCRVCHIHPVYSV